MHLLYEIIIALGVHVDANCVCLRQRYDEIKMQRCSRCGKVEMWRGSTQDDAYKSTATRTREYYQCLSQ